MWRAAVTVLALAIAVGDGGQVIAEPHAIDQPAATVQPPVDTTASAEPERLPVGDAVLAAIATMTIALVVAKRWHRLDRAPCQLNALPSQLGFMMAVAMFVLGLLGGTLARWLFAIPLSTDAAPHEFTIDEMAQVALGVYAGQVIVVIAYFLLNDRLNALKPGSRRRIRPTKSVLLGVGAVLLAWPIVLTVANLVAWLRGGPVQSIAHETLRQLVSSRVDAWYVLLSIMVVFVAPVMEEVMYRGLLQRSLVGSGLGRWQAIIVTSAVFACMHTSVVEVHALAALFVLSLAMGWAYEKSGRLSASITMHVLFNAGNLAAALATNG